jgi:hypothetical protein
MTTDMEPPIGLSVWEQEIFDHLVGHMKEEGQLLERYEKLATDAGGHVAYLLRLIMEDERRHHRLFEEWCNELRGIAQFQPVDPQVPEIARTEHPEEVAATVRTFLAAERADRKDLERLRKLVKDVRSDTLWDVLLDVMELDTRKHIALLRFLERHPGR